MSNFIILGASGGIGAMLTRVLVAEGHRVMLAGRNEATLHALADEVWQPFHRVEATSFESVEEGFQSAIKEFGKVDGAANCVGSMLLKPAHTTSEEELLQTIALNLTSAFAVVRSGAKAMMATGGAIALVSSVAATLGLANHEAIAAAKAAVEGLTRSAAATYVPRGIRVNCVAPGLVQTPLSEKITNNEAALKASVALHPLGRIGTPADIATTLAFLLTSQSSWITGQVIAVDGGLSKVKSR